MSAYCMSHLFSLPSIGDVTMQLPLADPETLFEELLQDLPPETVSMAREFKAFARVRKIKTPAQLLRVVLLYCGVDKALPASSKIWLMGVPGGRGCGACVGRCTNRSKGRSTV